MKKLNKEQRQAIALDEQIVLVKSAVGSGKTTVLTHKIAELCNEGVDPASIVVLTFTRRAANEIHKRLSQFSSHMRSLEYCGTFHSVANRLLRDYFDISVLGFSRDFSIIEDRQRQEILEELCFDHNIRISKKELRNFPGNKSSDKKKLLLREYTTYKKRNNIVDFDDLMIYLNELLALQTAKFSWVIVDEFQDCDDIQSQILKKFIHHGAKLFAVGDPYQTIYHWRGSNPVIFEDFAEMPQAHTTELSLNYRSTANIVEAAKELFAPHNKVRAFREPGTPVMIKKHLDAFNEATYLAFSIKSLAEREIDYKQIAILYRRQLQREELVKVFQQQEIPFVIQRQVQLSSIAVLDWLYNLFVLCLNRKNLFAKRMVFSHRKYGAKKEKRAFLQEKIANFQQFAQQYVNEQDIWDYFALHKFLLPTSASFTKDEQLVLTFLQEILPDKSQSDFFHALRQNILCRDYNLEAVVDKVDGCRSDGVQLMTLHSSKGLEFSHVFIIGANDGNIPLQRQNLEEEKRLFYVGITRAKECVEISYTNATQLYGATKEPSLFLEQLNPSCIYWEKTNSPKADLKELTSMVKESKLQNKTSQQQAFHDKYGTGLVVAEDENSFVIDFPGYGEKSFSKVFCPLKFETSHED